MNSTRNPGTASRAITSPGALRTRAAVDGGVLGRMNESAAKANDATAATIKILGSAACSAGPVFPARRKTNGQLAAIHPMVPHNRTRPKSFGSLAWWKHIELVSDSVGTK